MVAMMNRGRCIGKMFASCRSICEFHFSATLYSAQLPYGERQFFLPRRRSALSDCDPSDH
jgi:hypothetical protein